MLIKALIDTYFRVWKRHWKIYQNKSLSTALMLANLHADSR